MLSPRAIHLFLKYFDSIDEMLSARLAGKRTWDEEALTFVLTDLLDENSQQDYNHRYTHADLVRELSQTDEPISIDVTIQTHSYPKSIERYVTQSDIGLILSYQDQFITQHSFRRGWLMQAKRLFRSKRKHEDGFTINSSFESFDSMQHERMKKLRDWAECDFIQYLLYCPRPSKLSGQVREHLSSARINAIAHDIFDYSLGLELRDDLLSNSPTIAAGIFVATIDFLPNSFLAVHSSIFNKTYPFSWFIVSQLAQTDGLRFMRHMSGPFDPDRNLNNPIIEGLIKGDYSAMQKDDELINILEDSNKVKILPAHTINIRVINGIDRP